MSEIRFKADVRALDEFAVDLVKARTQLLGRLAERGYQLLRKEIKETAYVTGNLMQGVAPPEIDYPTATLTVSARSGRTGGGDATLHRPDGSTKRVSIRGQSGFNYAETVARGRSAVRPKAAKALLIPVPSAPSGESYLTVNGKIYIFRRSAGPTKPNPFDERAAEKLQADAPGIWDAVLREHFE